MKGKIGSVLGLVVLLACVVAMPASAAATTSVLGGGVCINEVLVDPNGSTYNTDTDGNGTADHPDEFVELYNLSGSDIDISGWELWDAGNDAWFTFDGAPDSGTTILSAGAYALVIGGLQTGGSLPVMTNPDSLPFEAGSTTGIINNGGDNVVLYDPGADEYIQIRYNGNSADDPTADYSNFSTTAIRVGSAEDWGFDLDGVSLTRNPSGDTNVVQHQATFGSTASPNAVRVAGMASSQSLSWLGLLLSIGLLGVVIMLQRQHN